MKILYFDCFSGISGDMFLGAMLDIGVQEDYLRHQLNKLKLSGYELEVFTDQRKGITGTRVNVRLLGEDDVHDHSHHCEDHEHHHDSNHHSHNHHDSDHHHHSHDHNHHQGHQHHVHHEAHRNLHDITKIIQDSDLSEAIKRISINMFTQVAKAEAKIHGKTIENVHFHEVGAVDSIVDIVGAAICIDALQVDKILFSSIAVGGGFVNCAHGKFPVPAPATVEILKGIRISSGEVEKELTTPTGAAIVKVLADEITNHKEFTIKKIGYGIGKRDNPVPNVLRVFLGEIDASPNLQLSKSEHTDIIIECNIDDCNPEIYPFVMEKLLEAGAMDVWITPIVMKKGRSAINLNVLCNQKKSEEMIQIIFEETTTIGVRTYGVTKVMMDRKTITLQTPYGAVSFKSILRDGKEIKCKPEFEDCKKIAIDHNMPLTKVYDTVKEIYRDRL